MLEVKITRRGMKLTPALEQLIENRMSTLDRYASRATLCRVALRGPAPHHRHAELAVSVEVHVPGLEAVVSSQSGTDVHVALHRAFDAVRSQLARRQEAAFRGARRAVRHASCS